MAAPVLFDGNIAEGLPRDTRSYYPPPGTEFLGVGFRAVVEGDREKALMLDHSSDQAKPMAPCSCMQRALHAEMAPRHRM